MKKLIFVSIVLMLSIEGIAQVDTIEWAPKGATWLYRVTSQAALEYYKLVYSKDTLIGLRTAKQIKIFYIKYNGVSGNMIRLPEEFRYDEYLYSSRDTVYWLSNGGFSPLYVFSATTNQNWIFPPNTHVTTACNATPDYDTALVRSTQVKNYDGKSFNTQYLDGQKKWNIGNTIIKNIGSAEVPFPTISWTNCQVVDGGVGACEQLECYFDSLRGSIDFSGNGNCYGKLTSLLSSNPTIEKFEIYPNPTEDYINIESVDFNYNLMRILNMMGQIVYVNTINGKGSLNVDVSNFESGVYFVQLISREGLKSPVKRFYKK